MSDLNVLVVEDEPTMRDLLRNMLLDVGVGQVTAADNGAEAKAAWADDEFHIVMLDIGLPDADGKQLMEEFKEEKPGQFVVLVTADDSIESIQQAIRVGANGYVVKPYSREKIQDVVNNYVMVVHGWQGQQD